MRNDTKVERDEVQDQMSEDTIPNFMIEVKVVNKQRGTYLYDDEEEGVIRIHLDAQDRFDLVQRFNNTLMHLRANHSAIKAGCLDCNSEVILSGAAGSGHRIETFSCPECDGDLINLDAGDIDD